MELEHRRWMYKKNYPNQWLLREEFVEGVAGFIVRAKTFNGFLIGGMIRCPCVKCKCVKFLKPEDIKDHLYKKGFMKDYYVWIFHGEVDANAGVFDFQKFSRGESSPLVEKNFENSRFNKMVKDTSGMYSGVQSQPSVQHSPNDETKRFYEHLEEASHPFCEGSMHSKLSVAHGLLFIKSHWNVSVAAMDYIIGLMNELDPNKIDLPNNYYTAKKLVPNRGEVGALDSLQRLIIAPDGTNGFFPNTLSTRVVMNDEVFEETHVKKKKDGTRILVKPHAEGTYDGHTKVLDEWRKASPLEVAQPNHHPMMLLQDCLVLLLVLRRMRKR